MRIEIINTGSELMLGRVLNTHQQWLCRCLADEGYVVDRQQTVDDSAPAIQRAVAQTLAEADVVLVTGGLGPTGDDRTRDLIAALLGCPLREDPLVVDHIHRMFTDRHLPVPASTRVQALVPEGATVLLNAHGTAPGLILDPASCDPRHRTRLLVMLPGPPRELRPMFTQQFLPVLRQRLPPPTQFACRTLKTTGLGESLVEERIAGRLQALMDSGLDVGYCARMGEVDVRFVARGEQAAAQVAEAERIAREVLAELVFGVDDDILESVVVRRLTVLGQTVALAESCTGGAVANRLTNVPGASAAFLAGWVTYSNEAKQRCLGVRLLTLQQHGAVSEEVVREMAEGARERSGADYALAVTGIAGPSGGTQEKPVGTVWMALASARGTQAKRRLNSFDRETFKFITTQQLLDMLRRELGVATPG